MTVIHMSQGDLLYLPQGVLHFARALEHTPSLHITVGLHRSAMSVACILAVVVTAQTLGVGEVLTTAMVEEMGNRSVVFGAFGVREHWVNQPLPPDLHEHVARARDPVDAMAGDLLTQLKTVVQQLSADLLLLMQSGGVSVPGEPPGLARHRHIVQAAELADELALSLLVAMPLTEVLPLAATGFWMQREITIVKHFANFGPRHFTCGADVQEALDSALWCRRPLNVVALRRPGSAVRLNGFRLTGWSPEEVDAAAQV